MVSKKSRSEVRKKAHEITQPFQLAQLRDHV